MASSIRHESQETDRLLALTDGVIAIAITLLVLDITVPELRPGTPSTVLVELVSEQGPEFLSYVLSFLVIGWYWMLHRRVFIHIDEHDNGLVVLNLVFLLMVAFVPFATSVLSTYPEQFGTMFYAGVLALTGLSLLLLWGYASRHDILEEGLTSRLVVLQSARFLASPLVFVLSIGIALVSPTLAVLSWLLLVPINGFLQSRMMDSLEAAAEKE
ncbi:TMEM175 family protein [Haloferax sp. YSSS75]|uniref:TMEM175 family protein n=1 Tax=Haloferax sp. YSSS75 TaxID=3388564 RepID=UPI00398C9A25